MRGNNTDHTQCIALGFVYGQKEVPSKTTNTFIISVHITFDTLTLQLQLSYRTNIKLEHVVGTTLFQQKIIHIKEN